MIRLALTFLPVLLALSACGPSAEQLAAEARARRLDAEVAELTNMFNEAAAARQKHEQEFAKQAAEKSALQEQLRAVQQELEASRKKAADLEREHQEYRARYKVSQREKLAGEKLPQLVATDGSVFKQVSILQVTPGELRFRHAGGVAALPLGELEPALRARAAYEPTEANAWLMAEQKKPWRIWPPKRAPRQIQEWRCLGCPMRSKPLGKRPRLKPPCGTELTGRFALTVSNSISSFSQVIG